MKFLRVAFKTLLLPTGRAFQGKGKGVYFLIYHRVGCGTQDETDLAPSLFRKQMKYLRSMGAVVPFASALETLRAPKGLEQDLFVITFDDGFADFRRHVYPVMLDFSLPVTLFVTSGFVEGEEPEPGEHPGMRREEQLTWDELGKMEESGLVTLGAHTHSHRPLPGMTAEQVSEELERSNETFKRRLGFVPRHFAYPFALEDKTSDSVVRRYYETAVIGGGVKASPGCHDSHRIPRVPVRRSDGWLFFLAKMLGRLAAEEKVYGYFRRKRAGL